LTPWRSPPRKEEQKSKVPQRWGAPSQRLGARRKERSAESQPTAQFIITVDIDANTYHDNGPISVVNSGDIAATSTLGSAFGIRVLTKGDNGPISVVNSGDVFATATGLFSNATGIYARESGTNSAISLVNSVT
jgi:hypothetical protein